MRFRSFILENNEPSWLSTSTIKHVVYHGTDKNFDKFDYQQGSRYVLFSIFDVQTKGFFFSESPHDASRYGKNILECYINLRNPLLDPRRDKHLGIDRLPYEKEIQLMKILSPLIEKDVNKNLFIDIGVRRVYLKSRTYDYAHKWIYEAIGNSGIDWDVLDNQKVIDKMVQLGYDGTFVEEPESKLGRSIFVIKPEQISIVNKYNKLQYNWPPEDEWNTRKTDGLVHLIRPI